MSSEGIQFGRYLLLRKIAAGGMAEIFLAKQTGPGHFERSLVIKRILPHLAREPRFVGMFLDEAALAAQLSHPHIAQLFDFGEVDGAYYLALELVRGPDLASVVDASRRLGRPPPPEVSVRITTQMLEALSYAHGAADEHGRPLNLVHRDVSPQNVLVSAQGAVKLIDFGIAKAASAMQHTEAGMVKGKFTYMAPEQLRGAPLDGRCDMYAAALVLYELLTLQVALQGEGPAAIANALEARIQPIEELRPDLPAGLIAALGRALRRDASGRFRDCAEFGAALEAVLASKGAMVQSPQIAEFLKGLELETGQPLSPIGPGSGSGEKASRPASGPHDTAISGGQGPTLDREGATVLRDSAPPAEPSPARQPSQTREPSQAQEKGGFRWAAFALGLALVAGTALGWRWYSLRAPIPDVVPAAAAAPPSLPPLPRAKRPAETAQAAGPAPAPVVETKAEAPDEGRAEPPKPSPEGSVRRERPKRRVGKGPQEAQDKSWDWSLYESPTPAQGAPAAEAAPAYAQPQRPAPYPQPAPSQPPYYYQPSGYCAAGYYRNGYYCYRGTGYPAAPAAAPNPGQ
ncbi:MAG: serine/threonine protein kinase [Myxococcales bacterium]